MACHLLSAPGLGPAAGCLGAVIWEWLLCPRNRPTQAAGARILEEIMPQLSLERLVSVHVAYKSEEE